ncbi:MAG: hypothetical protein ABW065_09760 [Solirubrobacterales bacterium]
MPLEGHYARQTTPLYKLSPREIRAALGVLIVTAVAILAVVLLTVSDSAPGPAAGCIRANVAGIVGAETISACGEEAVSACQKAAGFSGDRAETVIAACEEQGIRY